jgi:uncharacterized protein YdhG (YjbR/CyaY superfamily)
MPTVDEYLAEVPTVQKEVLLHIRSFVKQLVPDAEESISYMMPAFKYKQRPLLYYAAFKNHLSVFPTSGPTETLKDKLQAFTITKGTVQFTLEKPLPDSLLQEIILTRKHEIDTL